MEEKIIQISAARGPAECSWVVAQLYKVFLNEMKSKSIEITEMKRQLGDQNRTLDSVSVLLVGIHLNAHLENWIGPILWIGQSPYRKYHKRKNWFVSFEVFEASGQSEFDLRDLKFDTFRSSGAGGQHVNKVETAVRAIHIPTGISVVASTTPSQLMNKKIAIEKLEIELKKQKAKNLANLAQEKWSTHNNLERGNPVRVYEGIKFKLIKKKDHGKYVGK